MTVPPAHESVPSTPNASGGGRLKGAPELRDYNGTRLAYLQWAYEAKITDELLTAQTGQEVLDLSFPIQWDRHNLDILALLQQERQIKFGGSIFRIRTQQAGWDSQGQQTWKVHCEALWYDLTDGDPRTISLTTSPTTAINSAIAGTGWTVGTVSVASGPTFSSPTAQSPLALLRSLPATFGGELYFDNVNQKVNLVASRGNANSGILYAHGKNISQSQWSWDTTGLVTRLYPYGNGTPPLDISSVNGGVKYLEDYSFYDGQGWARRIRAVQLTNSGITDPNALKAWGQGQLSALSQPQKSYTVTHQQIATDVTPGLGDTVTVWDRVLGVRVQTRIVKREWYPLELRRNSYTINTLLHTLSQSLGTAPQSVPGGAATTDVLPPAEPGSVSVTMNYGFDSQGNRSLTATITWNAVTTNVDGTSLLDFDHYEIEYQVDSGAWSPLGRTTGTAVTTPALAVQTGVSARVAAVDHAGNQSTWGTSPSAPTQADNVAPGTPTPLTLSSSAFPLAIVAAWDGNDTTGQPIGRSGTGGAPDFNLLEVHMVSAATAPSGFGTGTGQVQPSAGTLIDIQRSALGGQTIATGLNPNQPYWFTSVAVDRSNNRSGLSTPVSGASTAMSGSAGYIAAASIGDAQIGSLNVTKLQSGTMSAIVTVSGRVTTATAGQHAEMNSTGFQLFNAAGQNTVTLKNDGTMAVSNPIGQTFSVDINGNVTLAGSILAGSPLPQSAYNQNHVQNSGFEDLDPSTNGIAAWSYHSNAASFAAQYQASPTAWNATTAYAANVTVMHNGFVWWSTFTAPPVGAEPGVTNAWQQVSYGIGTPHAAGTNWSMGPSNGFSSPSVTQIAGKKSLVIRTTDTSSGASNQSNLINVSPGENWQIRLDAQVIGALRRVFVRVFFFDSAGGLGVAQPPAATVTNQQILTAGGTYVATPGTATGASSAATSTAPALAPFADVASGYTPANQNVMRISGTVNVPPGAYGMRIAVYNWTGAATGTSTLVADNVMAVRALDGHAFASAVITGSILQTALTGQRIVIGPGNPFNDNYGNNGQVVPVITFWPSFTLGSGYQPPRITTEEYSVSGNVSTSLKLTGGSTYDPAAGAAQINENQLLIWARQEILENNTSGTQFSGFMFRIANADSATGREWTSSLQIWDIATNTVNVGSIENNSGMQWANGELRVTQYRGNYSTIAASAFPVRTSMRSTKRNIRRLPFDPVEAVKAAGVHMYQRKEEYSGEDSERWRMGLMVEDLPELLHHHHPDTGDGDEHKGYDLVHANALVHAALRDMIVRVEKLEERVGATD